MQIFCKIMFFIIIAKDYHITQSYYEELDSRCYQEHWTQVNQMKVYTNN